MTDKYKRTIGRAEGNTIQVNYEDVSENHAVIYVEDRELIIEDLNSSNGTFVNGFRIKKVALKPEDKVSIVKHPFDVIPIFKKLMLEPEFNDYSREFGHLKKVYDDYQTEKEKIVKEGQRRLGLRKFMIMSLPVILFVTLYAFFSGDGSRGAFFFPVYIALNSLLQATAMFLTTDKKRDEKLKLAKIEFNKKYKCPRCKTYQLSKEWELHRDDKQCPNCKAIWAKEYIPEF
ncbi:MAG: FHA domain-containing protein [Tannerellaceae bacterium]|jgi:ssDNA-binding Zn-finger/Zn-ribbon topoisomerase 1|nr:FHA domain-containing protein [Tannerellaceae bacterium]